MNDDLLDKVETLRNLLTSYATGGDGGTPGDYERLRSELLKSPVAAQLPRWLRTCRNRSDFWSFIKPKFAHWEERRQFLREEFGPALDVLEGASAAPADEDVSAALQRTGSLYAVETWQKALRRRSQDPEGAITSARTLLETVCKYVLDELRLDYEATDDLPKLYGKAARGLNLAPQQHEEELFRKILGGCHAIVEALGALRNKLGDSHGHPRRVRPAPRHAALAVNLAGATACFLIETLETRSATPPA